jgi:sugar lactone lactonase YvrE
MSTTVGTSFTRRQLLGGSLVAGVATMFGSSALVGCGGDGSVTPPNLTFPRDVAALLRTLTLDGTYLIADPRTGRLYRIDQAARTVSQLDAAGTVRWTFGASADPAMSLSFPTDIALRPDGSVYVVDQGRVVLLTADGAFMRAIDGFGRARSARVDADGGLWVIDTVQHQVKGFTADGSPARSIAEYGTGAAQLNGPRGLTIDAQGQLHVVDSGNATVKVFSRAGALVRSYGAYGAAAGQFKLPRSVAVAANGLSYVADPTAGVLQVFDPSGAPLARLDNLTMGSRPAVPLDVTIAANGLVQVRLYSWTTA